MSDDEVDNLQHSLEQKNLAHGLSPSEVNEFIAGLKTVRKEYKEEKANSRKKPPKAARPKNS